MSNTKCSFIFLVVKTSGSYSDKIPVIVEDVLPTNEVDNPVEVTETVAPTEETPTETTNSTQSNIDATAGGHIVPQSSAAAAAAAAAARYSHQEN